MIKIGSGLVPGSGTILSHLDSHLISFGGVSISSDDGFDADWETSGATSGNSYTIRTPDDGSELKFDNIWLIPDQRPSQGSLGCDVTVHLIRRYVSP